MSDAANDAEFLGIVMSDSLVEKSSDFTKAMGRSKKAIQGLGLAISEELMPFLTQMANRFTEATAGIRKDSANLLKTTIDVFFGIKSVITSRTRQ